jgi:hypothetical protein
MIGKQGSMVGSVIGIVVVIIVIVAAAIPITQQVIDDQNFTGIVSTLVGLIPLFLAIVGVVIVTTMIKA